MDGNKEDLVNQADGYGSSTKDNVFSNLPGQQY